ICENWISDMRVKIWSGQEAPIVYPFFIIISIYPRYPIRLDFSIFIIHNLALKFCSIATAVRGTTYRVFWANRWAMGWLKFIRNKRQRLRELSRLEWALLGAAVILLPVTVIGLWLLGLQKYQSWMARWPQRNRGAVGESEVAAKQAARMVA